MPQIVVPNRQTGHPELVDTDNPFPVREEDPLLPGSVSMRKLLERNVDIAAWMAFEGRVYTASDADQNDIITAQTSFADTTPAITLRVPEKTVCIPLLVRLQQTGSVGGGDVNILMEFAGTDRYASSGTTENVVNKRVGATGNPRNQCTVLTGATITATGTTTGLPLGYLPWQLTIGADVSPAEGISSEYIWTPTGPSVLEGPASINIYAYAASTGPSLYWGLEWIEIPIERFGF